MTTTSMRSPEGFFVPPAYEQAQCWNGEAPLVNSVFPSTQASSMGPPPLPNRPRRPSNLSLESTPSSGCSSSLDDPSGKRKHSGHDLLSADRYYSKNQKPDSRSLKSPNLKSTEDKRRRDRLPQQQGVPPFPRPARSNLRYDRPVYGGTGQNHGTLLQLLSCRKFETFQTYRTNESKKLTPSACTKSKEYRPSDVNGKCSRWNDFKFEIMRKQFAVLDQMVSVPEELGKCWIR
jgi:hypothetical protein